jgi:hypothetical protein
MTSGSRMIQSALTLALGLLSLTGRADASTLFDYVTFDGIDYIRWPEEPGRALTRNDLGLEFATIECSFGEDLRGCPYGIDAAAAFLPSGTRIYAVRGHSTNFRLAAVWQDRIFLYQAWRNPRAKTGGDLYDLAGKVRAIDVSRGEPSPGVVRNAAAIDSARDVEALVDMVVHGHVGKPSAHTVGEPRYWLTFWLVDGTTLGRPYFTETRELMGGLVLPGEFAGILERYLRQ